MDDHNVAIGFYPQGGDDPAPTAPTRIVTEVGWGVWVKYRGLVGVYTTEAEAAGWLTYSTDRLIRVTLTYEVPK